jgi:hypothetical protein
VFVLYNPQVDDFLATPPHFRLLKRRALKKYGFLLDIAKERQIPVKAIVDGTMSAFVPERIFGRLPETIRQWIARAEFDLWISENNFSMLVERVDPPREPASEALLAFSYKAATGPFRLRTAVFSKYKSVVFHLSHYFISTAEKSRNIRTLPNAWLAGDSDITGNAYFREFFCWYQRSLLVMPFSVSYRFKPKRDWDSKVSKCVATGTFHDLTEEKPAWKYRDFMGATGSTTYHPLRKDLYEREADFADVLDCRVSPFRPQTKQSGLGGLFQGFNVSQKKYFSMDIADLYDSARFAVVGEELSGFPALGAFEAMACGSVLLADPKCYIGLDLKPFVHFVPHNGTLENVVSFLRNAPANSQALSTAGSEFVERAMRPSPVFDTWIACLQRSLEAR